MNKYDQAIAVWQSMIPAWHYGSGHSFGSKVTDCQGAIVYLAEELGETAHLTNPNPYNVTTNYPGWPTVPYTKGMALLGGWLIIFGNPNGDKTEHVGMLDKDVRYYWSMYAEKINVARRKIDNTATMQPMYVVKTDLTEDESMSVYNRDPIGTITIDINPNTQGILSDGKTLTAIPKGQTVPAFAHGTLASGHYGGSEVYYIASPANGNEVAVLKSNVTKFTPVTPPAVGDTTHKVQLLVDGKDVADLTI